MDENITRGSITNALAFYHSKLIIILLYIDSMDCCQGRNITLQKFFFLILNFGFLDQKFVFENVKF